MQRFRGMSMQVRKNALRSHDLSRSMLYLSEVHYRDDYTASPQGYFGLFWQLHENNMSSVYGASGIALE